MSSFFTLPASQRKRKRADERASKTSKRRATDNDEEQPRPSRKSTRTRDVDSDSSISGDESEGSLELEAEPASDGEATSEEDEDPADRRIRLAERYLDTVRETVDGTGFDAEDVDKDLIAQRLREDVDEVKGRQYRLIAKTLDFADATGTAFHARTQTTTGVAVCTPFMYTVSKDKYLVKWELATPSPTTNGNLNGEKKPKPQRRRPKQLDIVRGVKIDATVKQQHGHTGDILSVAASPDGRYIATGGADKKLIIWSAETLKPLKTFTTHRDSVTDLAFAPSSYQAGLGAQLFSSSTDRTLKTYSLNGDDSLAYVETLFGHQDHVSSVAAMAIDQCVSVGARDRTARLWRVVEETQLVFRADSSRNDIFQTGSVDCVAAIPPTHFVTGSDSGSISLWSVHKKKPLFTLQAAHGSEEPLPLEEATSEEDPKVIEELKKVDKRRPIPRPITALASLPGTDIVISGSWDGYVRVWKVADDKRTILPMGVVGKAEEKGIVTNGDPEITSGDSPNRSGTQEGSAPVKGVINSLAVFERRKQIVNEFGGKKEGECQGLCILAGTGKEMRMGRWRKFNEGKNGGVVFEIPLLAQVS